MLSPRVLLAHMGAKTNLIGLRVDDAEMKRLKKCSTRTGIEPVTLARAALAAALDYFDQHGRITLPLEIAPTPSTPPPGPGGSAPTKNA